MPRQQDVGCRVHRSIAQRTGIHEVAIPAGDRYHPRLMIQRRGTRLAALLALMLLLPVLVMWQRSELTEGRAESAAAATATATREDPETATTTSTPAPTITLTATATATSSPTATLPPTPTVTPSPLPTGTATPLPSATPPDRTCPDPAPVKPDYLPYSLGGEPWPTPDPAGFTPHFRLRTPVELDEEEPELRINPGYPYGHDGGDRYLLHNGVDISGSLGTPVLAAADGVIAVAQDDYTELYGWRCDWYGHLVVLELDEPYRGLPVYVLYGHVINLKVATGDRVLAGEPLAEVGVGGAATAAHLHLEVRVGGNEFNMTRNPMLWLAPEAGRGVLAGRLVDPEGRPWHGVQVVAAGPDYTATWSHLDDPTHYIRPDDELGENFVFGNLRPGRYRLLVTVQGEDYVAEVEVEAGQVSRVEIVTAPFKTPTPTPPVTRTPVAGTTPETSGDDASPTPSVTPEQTATPGADGP